MKLQVYSVYDHKTEVFHAPNYFHNDGHALRELSMVLGKPNTAFTQYPEDFSIYQVGTFEDSKGLLQPLRSGEGLLEPFDF